MKFIKVVSVAVVLYSFYGYSVMHSDDQMREMIRSCTAAHDKIRNGPANPVFGIRCPYDDKSDDFKFDLIEDGYNGGYYSLAIKNELRTKKLYPMLEFNAKNRTSKVAYLCEFGCFALDTQILTYSNKKFLHEKAGNITYQTKLAAIGSEFFFDKPEIKSRSIEKIIKSKKGEEETLLAFRLSSGPTLKVTVNHGMVLSDGRVVASQNVKESDTFLDYAGKPVQIIDITKFEQNAGVINFRLKGPKNGPEKGSNHIMGAEGVLVGDHAWQSDMRDDLNAIAIRRHALH